MLGNRKAKDKKYLDQLIEKTKNKGEQDFIRRLYSEVSQEDLISINESHLIQSADSISKLFKNRKGSQYKINIFRSSEDADYATVEIVTPDIPFLIDSIGNELKQQQCDIHLIVHPILLVERDKNGNFVKFNDSGMKETIIQFHISNWLDEAKLKVLKARLNTVMECIHYGVEDWRKMTSKMTQAIEQMKDSGALRSNEMRDESIAFLEWLLDNNLVFLGCYETKFSGNKVAPVKDSKMGVVRSDYYNIGEVPLDSQYTNSDPLFIRKWDSRSVVHRSAHMDLVVVKKYDQSKKCVGAYHFLGLFTSSVYYQSVRQIPLMRKKIGQVIQRYGYPESSHNCKELVTAMESFPRGELLQMSADELFDTATGIVSLTLVPRVKVFIRKDRIGKFTSCIAFIPERRFNSENRVIIENIVCRHLNGNISKRYVQVGESSLTRLQLIVRTESDNTSKIDISRIEKDIMNAISVWSDQLSESLEKYFSKREAITLFNKYKDAFDVKYCSFFTGSQAVHDIKLIEQSLKTNQVEFDIYISTKGGAQDYTQLKIYSPDKELPLSSTLPVIENLGFYGIDEVTYPISAFQNDGTPRKIYIHHFKLNAKATNVVVTPELHDNIITALQKIWRNELDDDKFNSLIVHLGATWREATMIRAYSKYLKQTDFPHTPEYALEALITNPEIAKKLIRLFNHRFDIKKTDSKKEADSLANSIINDLTTIKSITEDRVIRSLLGIIQATQRTNFFQTNENGEPKDYISFKIASSEVEDLPKPKPYAEVWVYSPRFEAIHLRGGKVARGGLRWSDRKEDFRTEVLGLMKAQMTKNSVIVPVGSKGGFVLKKVSMADGRDAFMNEGVACYKTFLSGILDITDNIIHNKIVPPKDVNRKDGDDPYLVVAADKGTATFSDYANSVSEKYGFWLGDAFASGGSVGYDHKKMAITAKGGWISVERHFQALGKNIDKETFTATGIGDMAGDVFGNGMLLSSNMHLLAAFNHAHIFIDPNPDTKKSYAERQRLFRLPRSQWTDYDPKLISKGGGVFDRKQKSIPISAEARKALNITETSLSPDALIRAILTAPVDLLWNGGIGTYVKSKNESNERLGDKSNDSLRINGEDLRCKIIGEGGNLGMTQLGRIEYAKNGGRLNTDFIDNSAGVDCSDHEVNIKIGLSDQLISGKMKRKERDSLLDRMTDEVAKLVLEDNFKQNLILTIEQLSNPVRIHGHAWLIKYLESKGELNRDLEYLPRNTELNALVADKHNLTRPEMSVIVAYAKNSIYAMLCKHQFKMDAYLQKYLYNYFPTEFQKKHSKLIDQHKLKNEILATVLTNDIVNTLGCSFFHQVMEDKGIAPEKIIKAYVIVKEIYEVEKHWKKIESLSNKAPIELQISLFNHLQALTERNILWVLNNINTIDNVENTINFFKAGTQKLRNNIKEYITQSMLEEYNRNIQVYQKNKEAYEVAKEICQLRIAKTVIDVVYVSTKTKAKLEDTARIFYSLGETMHFTWLISQTRSFIPRQYFQSVALRALVSEIQEMQMKLTEEQLKNKKLKSFYDNDNYKKYDQFISDLKASGEGSDTLVSMVTIAVSRVKGLAK